MGELFAEFGDLVFTLVIGYISAIEFLYVVRHLYHYSFNHDADGYDTDGENVSQLQDSMRRQLADAKNKEAIAGTQVMKDGVPYKDGFRLEAQQTLIDQLKEQLKDKELSDLRRQELEKELAKQMKIAEQLRKELAEAEAKYERQLKQEAEEKAKKLLEEQQKREKEERAKKEAEEQARKLVEAEKQREAEQRKREEEERMKKETEQKEKEKRQREEQERREAEEQARKLAEQEKQREAEQRQREEAEESARKLAEAEKQREAEQRQREEAEESARKLAEAEKQREAEESARKIAEAEKQREAEQRQREEAEESARKLAEAEAEKQREAEENARKLAEAEKQREAEENARKLAEAEKQREAEQRKREEEEELERNRLEAEENARKIQEAEKLREEEEQRQREEQEEQEENERRLLAIEKANEEKQAAEEAEAVARNLLDIEHRLEEQLRAAEKEAELTEKERQLIESIKKRDLPQDEGNEQKEAELLRKILEAREQLGEESEEEQSLRLIQRERDQEAKQKRIEENALLFLEAEKEMAEIQAKLLDAVEKREFATTLDSAPQTPAIEEPCIKKTLSPLLGGESVHHTVKTQLAQDLDEPYSVSSKTLLFPGVSDDASSIDPASSQQSSFSTQHSEEITTGTDSQYPVQERQEPDGEDTALTNLQYSDDYLRSLDGIKQRPLVREDGSGRRRAFKKRRSSNSSNSSRESRHSRDEELKMFTSLEEEEMKDTADSEFTPIRYTSEPTLKVKGHHRRHKRSPAKDAKHGDDSLRSSLERLGEETSDPWGEVKPEHYKQTEFWRREKNVSIDEEMEFEKPTSSEDVAYDTATNMPSASSFEEATQMQNEEALTALQKHSASWTAREGESDDKATAKEETARSDNTNLQTSQSAEREASPARSSASPRLRRSPRIEEIDQYEERWNETNNNTNKSTPNTAINTPTISVHTPLDFGPWRDEHGLIKEGLSDFYDFTASVNPSRSRSASRNPSPANTAPNTPLPKNVSHELENSNKVVEEKPSVEIYDDTGDLESNEFKKENIIKFIDSINGNEESIENEEEKEDNLSTEAGDGLKHHLQYVADDANRAATNQANLVPLVNIIDDVATAANRSDAEVTESTDSDMNALVSSLRLQAGRSRSRSKSPLPTPGNLQRSLENRRYKMIKHNEDILEKLIETKLLPELTPEEEFAQQTNTQQNPVITTTTTTTEEDNTNSSREQMDSLVQSLRVDRGRTRSKSPMRLPTADNLSKGLEKRRSKLIERNDEFIKQLEERPQTPDSPTITVEYVYEMEGSEETNIVNVSTPTISIESPQNEASVSTPDEDDDCSREKMNLLVQTLRAARSRSRSPMPDTMAENVSQTLESTRYYQFQHTEEMNVEQHSEILNAPSISIDFAETDTESRASPKTVDEDCSREEMDLLVQSLRVARSRSTSRSPMRLPVTDMAERAKTPEPSDLTMENVYELEKSEETELEGNRDRHSRSRTPSRSHSRSRSRSLPPRPSEIELEAYRSNTPSRSVSPQPEQYEEFHVLLNSEGSQNKTLAISSEEHESLIVANRQKQLDEEALEKLKYASEEMELRTLSPLILDNEELTEEDQDLLADLPLTERAKLLRKSPTTPDYDRTISEEMMDIERIKQERLEKGFKRSTYVGESMDLGSEFEPLRREAAHFQRSHSPSPSTSAIDSKTASKAAEDKRKLQDLILQELTTTSSSSSSHESKEAKSTGAIPKTERLSPCEIELTLTNEVEDTIRIKEEMLSSSFQSSTQVVQTVDKTEEYQEMRRRNAEFRRSGSASRSPLQESQLQELAGIEQEAAKRELKDKILHDVACSSMNFQDFSRHLNTDFFDQERRASDSALIQKPEVQIHEDSDLEPEEYHHFRRFSLAQEHPVEQYPPDEYIFIEEVEVRTRSGSRTWLREDFYSEEVDKYLAKSEQSEEGSVEVETMESTDHSDHIEIEENIAPADDDEEYSNASDDDRQTVVEVDDEIDEDISDFNERGPAEESHHETSECEEAEREMDRYAGREASDWNRVVDVNDILINENPANELVPSEEDEGAVGGLSNSPYDSDSFAIDQIYDEAIKNRKQSGILREFDSILSQMSVSSDVDEQYLLWSKTQAKRKPKNIEFNTQFLDNERKETEMRYLGDANVTARQSVRLRSRYGYSPVLQAKCIEDDVEVDLNYKPKKEYNWRKNFKLDEDDVKEDREITLADLDSEEKNQDDEYKDITEKQWDEFNDNEEQYNMKIDVRQYSIGGESVTLFSRSPERDAIYSEQQYADIEEPENEIIKKEEVKEEKVEKPKKKKTKKKLHKETKDSLEEMMNREDEDVYDHELYNRRSSSIQMETDSPKRKSRSRRSSRSSVTNEDSLGLFSPRSSVGYAEPIADIMEEFTDMAKETARPKKMKKRKKVKETMANVAESPIENKEEEMQYNTEPLNDIPAVSTVITPESSCANILSTLSPQNSVCVTPGSIDSNINLSVEELRQDSKEEIITTTSSSTTASSPSANLSRTSSIVATPVDTFDILKDANFYPLF